MHTEVFCFFFLSVLIILPSLYFHGFLGLVVGIIITPLAHYYWYPRVMLNEDGTMKDRRSIEEELERLRKPKVQ